MAAWLFGIGKNSAITLSDLRIKKMELQK